MAQIKPTFSIGQKVKAISFVDCFNKTIPERPNLTVTEIRLIESQTMKPFYRIKADHADGFQYVEAPERHFAAQGE